MCPSRSHGDANTYIPYKRHDSSQADPSYYFILYMLCCHYGPLTLAVKSLQVQQLFRSVTFDSLSAVRHLNVKFIHIRPKKKRRCVRIVLTVPVMYFIFENAVIRKNRAKWC